MDQRLRYLVNRKSVLNLSGSSQPMWDVFVSAYNSSKRVQSVFEQVNARDKIWAVLPEYGYSAEEVPTHDKTICFSSFEEADVVIELVRRHIGDDRLSGRMCIDITGFMRPHILFLVRYLHTCGVRRFDAIYTEPSQYGRKEDTAFSNDVLNVRQVAGYEGQHIDEVANDVLIIGVGYDHALVSRIVNEKDGARLIQLLSLPSLSADMYQESILRLDKTSLATDRTMEDRVFFAPANDPFVVATELSEMLFRLRSRGQIDNIYLSPLATKPQALGFALFYIEELKNEPASIIFPLSSKYSRETSTGVGRTWLYEVELGP